MIKVNLQLFAHKKGMGSTKNGRDSESKRLGVKHASPALRRKAQRARGLQNLPHPMKRLPERFQLRQSLT